MGWSEPPGGVRGTFEPLSAALSKAVRAPDGARKPMILWPWRLCPGTFLALQTNTRSCSMPCLLQDPIRVTFCVFTLSDLGKKEKEKRFFGICPKSTPTYLQKPQVNCIENVFLFYLLST